jgi:hypothetical protein
MIQSNNTLNEFPLRHHYRRTEPRDPTIINMKLHYSIAMVALLAAIPSTLADPDPVRLDHINLKQS